jgi:hypothetical protein
MFQFLIIPLYFIGLIPIIKYYYDVNYREKGVINEELLYEELKNNRSLHLEPIDIEIINSQNYDDEYLIIENL